eukprot:PITA_34194
MLLKIDLSKAFDSISWEYMQKILKAFGFAPSWIKWVSSLVSSSFVSILINGISLTTFRPSRGIRQGDPLSPFLFVILAEGLGGSIKSAILSHSLKGLAFHHIPAFSHQQFVDDNVLFGHPSVQEARSFKSILSNFSEASGALINKVKSEIVFFNTPPTTQRAIARILGFTIASLPSKYLGAPLFALALKHSSWNCLLEKLEANLFLWTHRALNMSSRLVLIKVVLQSMPTYLSSILAAPKWVLKAIKQLQRNFLWGNSGPNRKWALVKWEKACLPKKAGGIGLRDTEHSNMQLPNLRDNIPGLIDQDINPFDKVSQFWDSHDGQERRKWKELCHIISHSPEQSHLTLSSELQKRQILFSEGMDILRWRYEEKGIFTTQEAYKLIIKDRVVKDKLWDKIWNSSIWPKVSTFLWLLSHNRILTWENLRKRNFSGPSICPNCKQEEETTLHLMQTCQLGRKLWEKITFRCQKEGRVQGDIKGTLRTWSQEPYQSKLLNTLWQLILGLLMWNIWKEGNRRLFKDQSMSIEQIWTRLHNNLRETLSVKVWSKEDFPSNPQGQAIWDNWQIQLNHPLSSKDNISKHQTPSAIWNPPPINVFQLNFDGASRGNPGKTGFGGAIRDYQGTPLIIFYGSIGWNTNNAAELEGLWGGLNLAQEQGFFPLIAEGDSQIIITMASKLLQGSPVHKVSSSWRLAPRLDLLNQWFSLHQAISFKYIRREGNKLADFLANLGVDSGKYFFEGSLSSIVSESHLSTFCDIVNNDMQSKEDSHPDAGALNTF